MHLSETIHKKPAEKIIMVVRRHPLTFLPKILLALVMLIVPFVFPILFPGGLQDLFWGPIIVMTGSLYTLFVLALFLTQFVDYYLDLWVVTNERVIDIQQEGLFKRTVSEVDLDRVQDASSNLQGVFSTFFNYGDVNIQSAGAQSKFSFKDVPDPTSVRAELLKWVGHDPYEPDKKPEAKTA